MLLLSRHRHFSLHFTSFRLGTRIEKDNIRVGMKRNAPEKISLAIKICTLLSVYRETNKERLEVRMRGGTLTKKNECKV